MTTCVIRTFIIYILLVLIIRVTGKRQIGELEISELVSTILISEIASAPVANAELPLSFAVIPVLVIASLEIILSFLTTQSKVCKKIFLGSPTFLIRRGKLQPKELAKSRITLEELLAELRQCGIRTPEEAYYAILESNGKLSVIPRAKSSPATPEDMKLSVRESGIAHAIIVDGTVKKEALNGAEKTQTWMEEELRKRGKTEKEIFLMTVDDVGKVTVIERKDKK